MTTKAQQVYREFLHSDYGRPFSDFIGVSMPQIEYSGGMYRYIRNDYNKVRVVGDWCQTKKAAKQSYKKKLSVLQKMRHAKRIGA